MKLLSFMSIALLLPFNSIATPCTAPEVLSKMFSNADTSIEMKIVNADLRTMDRKLVEEVQNGKNFSYWVDDHDQIRFSALMDTDELKSSFVVLKDNNAGDAFIIKESGAFSFDKGGKRFEFKPKNSWDLKPGEIDEAIQKELNIDFVREADPTLNRAKVMKCTELLAAQQRGKNFIADQIISSVVVTTAGSLTTQLTVDSSKDVGHMVHPKGKTWEEYGRLLGSDLSANFLTTLVSGPVAKTLTVNNSSMGRDFITRTGTEFATTLAIKRPLYNWLNPIDPEELKKHPKEKKMGEKVVPYDLTFSTLRFFPKRMVDRGIVYQLPKMLIQSCLSNSNLSVYAGPRMLRIIDRYSWGLIYMAGRTAYLKHEDESEKKEKP